MFSRERIGSSDDSAEEWVIRIEAPSFIRNSALRARRSVLCAALCAFLLALCLSAKAHERAKLPKIGWLGQRPVTDPGGGYELLRHELRAIGYVEGKNITLEYRSADNHPDRLPALADELVRLKVDVIVAPAGNKAVAAKKATRVIPIVFASGGDPIAAKLVDSLARPGGNVTGYTAISAALAGKRLELLKDTIQKISRVGLLWNRRDVNSEQTWKESQQPSKPLAYSFIVWRLIARRS